MQFLPAFVLPQFLLCGLLVPRDQMPDVLHAISDVLPLSYAVDAMRDGDHLAEVARATWRRPRRRRRRHRAGARSGRRHPAPPHRLISR